MLRPSDPGPDARFARHHRTAIDDDALPHRLRDLGRGPAMDQRGISPGNVVAGMGEAVHRLAVGGEEQQTGGHDVEAADVVETGVIAEEIEDGAATLLVAGGGDDAERFVEGEPAALAPA